MTLSLLQKEFDAVSLRHVNKVEKGSRLFIMHSVLLLIDSRKRIAKSVRQTIHQGIIERISKFLPFTASSNVILANCTFKTNTITSRNFPIFYPSCFSRAICHL